MRLCTRFLAPKGDGIQGFCVGRILNSTAILCAWQLLPPGHSPFYTRLQLAAARSRRAITACIYSRSPRLKYVTTATSDPCVGVISGLRVANWIVLLADVEHAWFL